MAKKTSQALSSIAAIALCLVLLGGCAGGGNGNNASTDTQGAASGSAATGSQAASTAGAGETDDVTKQPWADGNVDDTSDLPTWTGKQLTVSVWYAHGTQGTAKAKAIHDVVIPEIERVTGVKIDTDASFDNGGQNYDVKLGMLVAANDLPDIMVEGNPSKLYDANKAYGISEDMLTQYAPTVLKKINQTDFASSWDMLKAKDGNYFAMPFEVNEKYINEKDPTVDKDKYAYFYPPRDSLGYVGVRDDILKKAYPNAYTEQELKDLYVKQGGKLTKDQLLDIPINNVDDFFQFLRNIDAVIKQDNIKEGNKPVQTIAEFSGADNWALLSWLSSYLIGADSTDWNYETYFDKGTQHIEWGYKQPWFKDILKQWNQLAVDGVASKEAFVDSEAAYHEKANNGEYAVTYAWLWPDLAALKSANKPYDYRKVYFNIPKSPDLPEIDGTYKTNQSFTLLKGKNIKDEDLPQMLRFYDYLMSDVGEKLWDWGPKSAGLFTEDANGVRTFVDKQLEAYMVNGSPDGKQKSIDYGLAGSGNIGEQTEGGTVAFTYANWNRSKFHPAVMSDRVPDPEAELNYGSGALFPVKLDNVAVTPDIWNFENYVEGAKKFTSSGKVLNDAILKVLASSNDKQFEDNYNALMALDNKIGATQETLDQIDAKFKDLNKDFMQNLK